MTVATHPEAPRAVEPTETTKPRKPRADKGKAREKLTPAQRAGRAITKLREDAAKQLERAHGALENAAALIEPLDKDKAGIIREIAERVEGLEVGGE